MAIYQKIKKLIVLLWQAFGEYKWQIALMIILSFVSGILEGVGINAIIPMFSIIDSDQALGNDAITQSIKRFFFYFDLPYTVKFLLIFIIFLFLLKALILFITQFLTAVVASDYQEKTSTRLLKKMLAANWPYLSKQKVGYLDQILTTDVSLGSAVITYVGNSVLIFANLIIYSLLAINISATIAILALITGGLVLLIFKPLFYNNKRFSNENVRANKELAHFINESVIGMKTIKSLFVGENVLRRGRIFFQHMRQLFLKMIALKIFINVAMQPLSLFFILGVFAYFYKTSAFSFVSFAIIVYAINKVFASFQLAQSQLYIMSTYIPHLTSVLNYEKEIMEHREVDAGSKNFSFRDQLSFSNVSFVYGKNAKVLDGVNFSISKGAMIGIIGPSGAGKTTIVDLLLRLLSPQEGKIIIDGQDISQISLNEWRKHVGYVSQDIFLMNDTIENNIKFYDASMSHEEVVEAAKLANIFEFINKQERGFETVIGERGLMLSGGQRQRVVLARVLARKPQLLILDEATSALDNESEAFIQKSIENLRGKITVIVIAHRLSTVVISDKLIVLDNGRLIEEGTPKTLLKDKESYFHKVYNIRA